MVLATAKTDLLCAVKNHGDDRIRACSVDNRILNVDNNITRFMARLRIDCFQPPTSRVNNYAAAALEGTFTSSVKIPILKIREFR